VDKNKFTKAQIVENIHSQVNASKSTIRQVVDLFFMEIRKSLVEDKIVELRGFGTFELKTRKGRSKARNPRTGEIIQGKRHSIAIFRAGKELKDEVWNIRNIEEVPEPSEPQP
jgi:integration host factor subunit beta